MSTVIYALSLFFFYSGRVGGAGVEKLVIDRAKALFEHRGINQREFAEALGVSPSWISSFFAGRRPANDVHLLIKIARFFGVTVGYLLNETERGRDAGAMTLLSTWEGLGPDDRRVVLQTALLLTRDSDGQGGGSSSGPPSGPSAGAGTTKGLKKRR